MTELERIKIAVTALIELGVGKNQEDIGKKMGYTNKSSFSQVLNGKVPLPTNFIDKLCNLDKRLVKMWLVNEVGNVLRSKDESKQVYIKNINTDDSIIKNSIVLIPTEAFAGFGGGAVSIKERDIKDRYVIPEFVDADFMIRIKGSSMYPKYNSGDVVACKMITNSKFIQWNKVHVISTAEQGDLIKRIRKVENKEYLLAISDNESYDPFKIPKDEIINIALVTGVIRLE